MSAQTNGFRYSANTAALKGLSPEAVVEILSCAGLDGVEWSLPPFADLTSEHIEAMAKVSASAGIDITGFLNGGSIFKPEIVEKTSRMIVDISGPGKNIRLAHPWTGYNYEEVIHEKESFMDLGAKTRKYLEKLMLLAEELDIRFVVETHAGALFASPAAVRYFMEGINPKYVGCIFDPANGYVEGSMRPRAAVEMLGPYYTYTHAKNLKLVNKGILDNYEVKRTNWVYELCDFQDGYVDFVEVCFALKNAGHKNTWISFEQFFKEDSVRQLKDALNYLKQCETISPATPQRPYSTFNSN